MTKSDDEKFKKTIQRMLNTKPDPRKLEVKKQDKTATQKRRALKKSAD